MKFLLKTNLTDNLVGPVLDQVTGCDDAILDRAERKVIEMISQYITKFDMAYEFRPWVDFEPGVVYPDGQRVRILANSASTAWEVANGELLVNNEVTKEFILTKRINACQPKLADWSQSLYMNNLYNTAYVPSNFVYPTIFKYDNPDYVASCGVLYYSATTDGSTITADEYNQLLTGGTIGTSIEVKTDSIGTNFNYFETQYIPTGSSTGLTATTQTIDFNYMSLVSGLTPSSFQNDVNYFNEYLLQNEATDFIEDDRSYTLISLATDLIIYEVLKRVSYRDMTKPVVDSHDLAVKALEDMSRSIRNIQLKKYASEFPEITQQGFGVRFGWNNFSEINKYRY
jgi:hypothetical protein